jgi:hypothetical protein
MMGGITHDPQNREIEIEIAIEIAIAIDSLEGIAQGIAPWSLNISPIW